MQFRTFTLGLLAVMITTIQASAQFRGTCGVTDPTELLERVTRHQKTLAENPVLTRSSAPTYIPITFILVADDNGNGRAREEQALDQLDKLNFYYAPQDIIFYLDELRYKDHTLAFTEPAGTAGAFQLGLVKDSDALNVFVTQSADNNSGTPGVTLGYYSSQKDWIVIRKDQFNSSNNTLAHEIGHFFGLPHPHSGWECEPYDEELHGNPVASIWSPCNGSLRVEFQNGTNCHIAGDRICDTNPDYNFGFGWSVDGDQCAEYTLEVRDPNGDVIDVIENNHMGYFIDCDNYMFTPDQQDIILADYLSLQRAYLRTGYTPVLDPVTSAGLNYITPINGEVTSSFVNIELDWDDVPGATDYLVVVDRASSFNLLPRRFIVQESFLVIDELTPDRTYYWRIWPFNETQTGAGWAASQNFVTGMSSAVTDIPSVGHFDLYPNPLKGDQSLYVRLESDESFMADMTVHDLTGRTVWTKSAILIETGKETLVSIEMPDPVPGLYILKFQSENGGLISRKFTVF